MQMGREASPLPTREWPGAPLGLDIKARLAEIDTNALDRYRLGRLRAELVKADVAGALLADPMNSRYATGTRNMAVWTMHAPGQRVIGRPVFLTRNSPRCRSGAKRISRSGGMDFTIFSAFDDVTM